MSESSQKIGMFLEWLEEQGVVLCRYREGSDFLETDRMSVTQRLAAYFDIDLDKLEGEKVAMLEAVRAKGAP